MNIKIISTGVLALALVMGSTPVFAAKNTTVKPKMVNTVVTPVSSQKSTVNNPIKSMEKKGTVKKTNKIKTIKQPGIKTVNPVKGQ